MVWWIFHRIRKFLVETVQKRIKWGTANIPHTVDAIIRFELRNQAFSTNQRRICRRIAKKYQFSFLYAGDAYPSTIDSIWLTHDLTVTDSQTLKTFSGKNRARENSCSTGWSFSVRPLIACTQRRCDANAWWMSAVSWSNPTRTLKNCFGIATEFVQSENESDSLVSTRNCAFGGWYSD